MEKKELDLNGKKVIIPKWNMKKQIQKQPLIFPLVSDAVASAVMMASDEGDEGDVGMFSAALIKSVMTGVGNADMELVFSTILEGVTYRNENGVQEMLTLDSAEKAGFTLAHLYAIAVEVVMENYGPLLKDGFQIMFGVMNNRPQESNDS